ncbi:hypothetical protein HDV05_007788, partial [Chytridiales sp. JEL 0842]
MFMGTPGLLEVNGHRVKEMDMKDTVRVTTLGFLPLWPSSKNYVWFANPINS